MSKIEKVYIVTSGDYSDYGIRAVFTDYEAAKKYCEVANNNKSIDALYDNSWYDKCEIETYTISNTYFKDKPILRKGWCVTIDKFKNEDFSISDKYIREKEFYSSTKTLVNEDRWVTNVYSEISKEHAKKLAIERIQIYTQNELEKEL